MSLPVQRPPLPPVQGLSQPRPLPSTAEVHSAKPRAQAPKALPSQSPTTTPPPAQPPTGEHPWRDAVGLCAVLVLAASLYGLRSRRRATAEALAFAAHEIKSPLGAMESYLDLMAHEGASSASAPSPQWAEDVRRMKGAAVQLRGSLDNLLQTALLESDHSQLRLEPVDLGELAHQAAESLRAAAEAAGIAMAVHAGSEVSPVPADGQRLRQVLLNLLGNALKFTPRGGRVVVELDKELDGSPVLCVRDTGRGMSRVEQGRLFKKFSRFGTSSGAGLGLYICRIIAEAHGGRIWVESEPGRGSAFFVRLPKGAVS